MPAATAPQDVILVHSSVAGAGQWRGVVPEFDARFRLHTPDLIGYGPVPAWSGPEAQTLGDQADHLASALPDGGPVSVVGHSFGGSVAMELAARHPDRVARLVLIEPNPFALLAEAGRDTAYAEATALRDCIKTNGAAGTWHAAAEVFADYWTGPGSWNAMPPARQDKFAAALAPNFHEWDAVMQDTTGIAGWRDRLPMPTTLIWAEDTVRSTRELAEILRDACPHWRTEVLQRGGHMAALTQPAEIAARLKSALA